MRRLLLADGCPSAGIGIVLFRSLT